MGVFKVLFITYFCFQFSDRADAAGLSQSELDKLARDVDIRAKVLSNLKNSAVSHTVVISLRYTGNDLVPSAGWILFFHSTYLLLPKVFPNTLSATLDKEKVRVSMYGGDLYSVEPVDMFREIKPNETRIIELEAAWWSVSKTDFMPYWYLVSTAPGVNPTIASSTASFELNFVEPFENIVQWKRYTFDQYNPFSPQDRMKRLLVTNTGNIEKPVIPTPLQMTISDVGPRAPFNNTWKIFKASEGVDKVASYVNKSLGIQETSEATSQIIRLSVDQLQTTVDEYDLHVNSTGKIVTIHGKNEAGLFYGVQSLLSLLITFPDGLPEIQITDKPRFEYRGMHIDVARNFHPVEDLKRLMDAMAMYKMNKLHLHLSDDEGWRLEIPSLPELTMVGSKRCHDLNERLCIIPQWGSGPYQNSSGTGFYTADDYKQLLRYAVERFIEIIPEFDMPGHAHAAIKAMEVRYNTTAADEFRLIDPDDTSFYLSVQQWMDNAINPCIESTYNFIAEVIDTVVDLHKDIQPLRTYHFGGDEVANGAWENSTKCNEFILSNPQYNVSKGLKMYFAERVANLTASRELGLRGWEDGFMDGNGNPFPMDRYGNSNMSANPWDNIWEWGASQRAYKLANAGYEVIMSQATDLYFDHPYEPDPEERGLYWATRFTDTRKTFGFLPDSLYDNIDFERSGKPLSKTDVCGEDVAKCDPLLKPENVIGIQGHLWSETVRTSQNFDYMIFPRLLALAERAWHKADFEEAGLSIDERKQKEDIEWEKFANTLGHKELGRLDELNIQYRIPPPGARVKDDTVEFSVTFPGLTVQYSIDNGGSWQDENTAGEVKWGDFQVMLLRTRSGNRTSRVVSLMKDESLPWTDQDTIDYIGSYLQVSAGVVNNLNKDENNYIEMMLQLRNAGNTVIRKGSWRLYFTNLYGVAEEILNCDLRVVHVNGDLYYFTPTTTMTDLESGKQLICTWHQKWWNTAKTDFFPNWYVWSEGMFSRIIANTNETLDYVLPYNTREKWKKTKDDKYNPYTTSERYTMHRMTDYESMFTIVPTPEEMVTNQANERRSLDGWVVMDTPEFHSEARYLASKTGLQTQSATPNQHFIHFTKNELLSKEEYRLVLQTANITIEAKSPVGAFYASQSLISLFEQGNKTVPVIMKIVDKPRFSYRGIMLDTARNFKPKEWIYKILDAMAMYKLNTLHFHLSDDEAWRLDIPGLPELTEIGANRCQDPERHLCLIPQRGSGPDKSIPGSGYYTVQDYKDILQYAQNNHITVIPEIDMPGHSRAAITSMEYREALKADLNSRGVNTSHMTLYTLSDAKVDGDLKSIQNWRGNALNPCMNSTYEFINKVLDELIIMHRGIQDLKTFHLGGDEVAEGSWDDSQTCKDLYGNASTTFLKREFVKRLSQLVASKDLDVAAWEDGVYGDDAPNPRTDFTSSNVYSYAWNNVWEDGYGKRSAQFANEGYKVILAMATHLYLDFPYEPDPEESGLYWATRYVNTKKIFGFMPDDIFANAEFNKLGEPIDITKLCETYSCPKTQNTSNVIGMQGTMFSDLIRTEEQMQYALFPKLLAVAERAWHKAAWEDITDRNQREEARKVDWERFASKLGHRELPRLEKQKFYYRVPPPGAIIEGDKLKVNTLYPNHDVEMSTDGGKTWNIYEPDVYLPREKLDIFVRTVSKSRQHKSRVVSLHRDVTISSASRFSSMPQSSLFVISIAFCIINKLA